MMRDDSPVKRVSIEDKDVLKDFRDAIEHIARLHQDEIAEAEIRHVLNYMKNDDTIYLLLYESK